MPYLNRIVVYLKAADGAEPAKIHALSFKDPNIRATEDAFVADPALKRLKPGEEVAFHLSATKGIADIYGLMIGWPGGCRVTVQTLLGEKGDHISDAIGVGYKAGVAAPCNFLYCRFNASGVLTCEDRQGVVITMDVGKPGKEGLCLTLVPRSGSSGAATFPQKEFPDLVT